MDRLQTCLIFIPTPTDPNRLKQIIWHSETDPQKSLIESLSCLEQGHHVFYFSIMLFGTGASCFLFLVHKYFERDIVKFLCIKVIPSPKLSQNVMLILWHV